MLSVELNDRERPASPGPSPLLERKAAHAEASKSKQWRLKIEEWLQENEKEQEREKTLRDKIAFERLKRENEKITSGEEKSVDKGLATLQEAKTDTEIYAKKSKVLKPAETENAECMPLKDKSKWRKSNLNVANSSESIDDERRKSRSRRNTSDTEMDTISFYIARSVDNLIPSDNISGDKAASQNVTCSRKDQQEQKDSDKTIIESIDTNPGILIGRSRFYQPMEAQNKIEPISNKTLSEVQETNYKKDCESKRSDEDMPTDREDVNFDRFSHMRKTTRRGKSRNRGGENENRKSEDLLESELKVNPQEIQVVYSKPQKFIEMDSKLPESNSETQNVGDEIVKNSGSYVGENQECGEEQKRKDKSMSLKAKLSKRLLSLTENLKVGTKPVDTAQSVEDKKNYLINDSSSPRIDKMLSERRTSLSEEKINPILEHRENILSRPQQDLVQIPVKNKVQATCNPIIISKPQFFKGSYASDSDNVPIAPETPTTPDVKALEVYPAQKGREECEKDEGFEETQSQLSEVASQGAGSSYDTDLADSPRSLRQMKDANTGKTAENCFSNLVSSVHSSGNKTSVDSKQDEKKPQENQILEPCQPTVNSYQSREATIAREPPKRVTLSKSNSVRMPVSKAGIGRNNLRATLSSTTAKDSEIKPQLPANLRTSSQSSRAKVYSSDSKVMKKPSLRGLGNLIETSPKIGRRVAAYTKAIKSMTHNLQDSKKFENYDVTQSMPPTPSEEKKTFTSGLKSMGNGKKARSSSSVYSPRPHSRLSVNTCLGPQSRRGSEKSISSDKSVNLSRKSSEASVITVKSATRSPVLTIRHPKRAVTSPSQLTSPTKTKTRIIRPKSPIQTKQLRVPNSVKPVTRTNSVPKQKSSTVQPNLAVRRTSSERASFTFMKATSASSAKSSPTKWTQEQNKFKSPTNQRPASKPISLASSQSRIKQRY